MTRTLFLCGLLAVVSGAASANEPTTYYIFPAGGQRGTTVEARVGGCFLHGECGFEMLGEGISAPDLIRRTDTLWFEGPVIPIPASQAAENYPQDYAAALTIAAEAPLGARHWRCWTSQGATPSLKFIVGDLPEIVEAEVDGEPRPIEVSLPVTINGRTFPREDVDLWSFEAVAGQAIHAEVTAARIGSPLDSQLEVLDPAGRLVAENGDAFGADSAVAFTAATSGTYRVRIYDIAFGGLQHYVYRLTISAAPVVESVYPLGGRRGATTRFELTGHGLPAASAEIAVPADAPADYAHRFVFGEAASNPVPLDVDDLDERLEAEPNDEAGQISPGAVPAVLNGRIDAPGDVDVWAFAAAAGEAFDVDLRASRLGSPLDSVLSIVDAPGTELARHDDLADGQTDSRLSFTAPAAGTYYARVEERFASRGGPRFAYRLRIAPPEKPDFRLRLATDALNLPRGGEAKLKIDADRLGGFNEAIAIAVEGLPPGATVPETAIPAGGASVELIFKADASATIGPARLTIRGTAALESQPATRVAQMPAPRGGGAPDTVLMAVALPTPFKVRGEYAVTYEPRGTQYRRRYFIDRGGYEGPLTVSLADVQMRHLQGVTGPTIEVPAGATEFVYPVYLPPWMEIGRTSRTVVAAVGEIVDVDGSRHKVSFSSVNQNEQLVALIDPGALGLQADAASIRAVPGGSVEVPFRVQRSGAVTGRARVELIAPAPLRDVTADAVEVAADQERGVLTIRFGPTCGDLPMPLTLRATATYREGPIVAETKLEVVPAR